MNSTLVWRALAAVFTAIVVVAGSMIVWNALRPKGPVHSETQRHSYTQPIAELTFVDFEASDVRVEAGTGPVEIVRELRWTGDKPRHTETWNGGALRISHSCGDADSDDCSIGYRVTVPAGTQVRAETSSGDVDVSNISARVRLETVSGEVSLAGITGDTNVETVSGDVASTGFGSPRTAVSVVSGEVNLSFSAAPQQLTVNSVSGDATVRVPAGESYRVKVSTVSGSRRVDVDHSQAAARSLEVETTSGDVTIAYA